MKIIRPLVATFISLILGLLVTFFAGENPWNVFLIFAKSGFGSVYDIGMTLAYSTPLILTGLSVAIAFKVGLFNIGAEGQLTIGALAAAAAGALFTSIPPVLAPVFAGLCAALAGGFWGGIAGYLKVKRDVHEVISTIMLNFIAAGVAGYVTVYLLKDTASQNPQTIPVSNQYLIQAYSFFQDAPVTFALILSLLLAVIVWVLLYRTPLGYEIRAVGENIHACSRAQINAPRTQILSMVFAGSLAGLVGVGEVLGRAGTFKLDFSPGYGFTGIAVAFLARGNPIAIIFSAILFGALQKGASDLEIYTQNVTSDLASILQALIILVVSADGLWEKIFKAKKARLV
jgi:simple sugar transport system permease protein